MNELRSQENRVPGEEERSLQASAETLSAGEAAAITPAPPRSVEVIESTLPADTATPSVSEGMERLCREQSEAPASEFSSLPDALAGSLGHLWCQYCGIVITVPAYDVAHTRTCDCRGELVQIAGCRDCGAARDHISDDCCPGCKTKWARRERADELTAVLKDIAMTPWRTVHG